jgi:hypothetical protein
MNVMNRIRRIPIALAFAIVLSLPLMGENAATRLDHNGELWRSELSAGRIVRTTEIRFEGATLRKREDATAASLDRVRAIMAADPSVRLRIEVGVSRDLQPREQKLLARKRAQNIARWMFLHGIDEHRFDLIAPPSGTAAAADRAAAGEVIFRVAPARS